MNKILLDQIHSELDNGNIDWNKLYTLHGQFIKEQPSELIEISKHNLEICKLNNKILSLQQDNNLSASDEILIDELNPLKKKDTKLSDTIKQLSQIFSEQEIPSDVRTPLRVPSLSDVLFFYLPWCKYCTEFYPSWNKLIKEYDTKCNMISVNANLKKNEELINHNKLDLKGYPSLYVITNEPHKLHNFYDKHKSLDYNSAKKFINKYI